MNRVAISALALVLATLSAGPARAQAPTPSADSKAAAEVLFREGKDLLTAGRFEEACPKLAESLRLDVGIGTMLYLAECYERTGHVASAWAQFTEAAQVANSQSDARQEIARERAAALAPKLPKLTFAVAGDASTNITIKRDGIIVGAATWATATPVDPGTHTVEASAPGKRPWTTTIEIAQAEEKRVDVPVLEDAPVEATPGGPAKQGESGRSQRTVGLALAGIGVVGVAFGTYFGLHAQSRLDDSNADGHCNGNQCDRVGFDARNESRSAALASTISFIAGGVLIVGGAALFFTAPRASAVALGPGGVRVRF